MTVVKKVIVWGGLLSGLTALAGAAMADSEDREYLTEASFEDGTSSLAVKATPLLGHGSALVGGNTLWTLGKSLSAGIGFYTVGDAPKPAVDGAGALSFSYGGLEAEAPLYTYRVLTLALAAHAGIGQVSYRVKDAASGAKALASQDVRVFEPSAAAFVHVTRRIDFGLAGGVRRVSRSALPGVGSGDLSGKVAAVLLRGHF